MSQERALESILNPVFFKELAHAVKAQVLKEVNLDPVEQIVPLKATFTLAEVYKLRSVSASSVTRKPWLRFQVADDERPIRSEVVAWLKKTDSHLKAEYELRIRNLGKGKP